MILLYKLHYSFVLEFVWTKAIVAVFCFIHWRSRNRPYLNFCLYVRMSVCNACGHVFVCFPRGYECTVCDDISLFPPRLGLRPHSLLHQPFPPNIFLLYTNSSTPLHNTIELVTFISSVLPCVQCASTYSYNRPYRLFKDHLSFVMLITISLVYYLKFIQPLKVCKFVSFSSNGRHFETMK